MITYSAITPHPPLLIPQIGKDNYKQVNSTISAMKQIAQELKASSPDTIVFVTPHGNVFSDCISFLSEPILQGDFSRFGASDISTSHKNDLTLVNEIEKNALEQGINIVNIDKELARHKNVSSKLDHGIMVPLYYFEQEGLSNIPIIAVTVGYLPLVELYTMGSIIKKSANNLNKNIAIIASGDLSHRLKDEGPYDYHSDGEKFDLHLRELISKKDINGILTMPEELVNNAGECGYRPIIMMLGALDGYNFNAEVLSYEGPFGVGYLTASLKPLEKANSFLDEMKNNYTEEINNIRKNESLPVKWARTVLEHYVKTGEMAQISNEYDRLRREKKAVFVSLKKHNQLRGCIGTIYPSQDNMAYEIAYNAISAGINDPRFFPMEESELDEIMYSVDILDAPEPCNREDLDCKKYGVIVSKGNKRGLLLPDLDGVDTVEKQLEIALDKAGISPKDNYNIERFEVNRYT